MSASEDWDIHGNSDAVRLVQPHPEVTLSAEQKQDEHPNVHQTNTGCKHRSHFSHYNQVHILLITKRSGRNEYIMHRISEYPQN